MNRDDFIAKCVECGLKKNQAIVCCKLYSVSGDIAWSFGKAKQDFTNEQVTHAAIGFTEGLRTDEVDLYFQKEFSVEQMNEAMMAFAHKLAIDCIRRFYKSEFSWEQMREAAANVSNISSVLFDVIYQPEFTREQMNVAFANVKGSRISVEGLKYVYREEFNPAQMLVGFRAVLNGFLKSRKQLYIC